MDAALFAAAGIPTVNYGLQVEERTRRWSGVDLNSVVTTAQVFGRTAASFCRVLNSDACSEAEPLIGV
jgi:hypothetical protein